MTRSEAAGSVLSFYRGQAAERRELLQALTPLSPFAPVLNIVLVPKVLTASH